MSKNNVPQPDINIEDTGKLMTRSGKGRTGRRIALIAIALIAVGVIGFFGYRYIGEQRYDSKVEMAEAAMLEGDYARAEEYYLAAIEMNDRKIPAREGLAYAYAAQEKYDEAREQYEKLYEDTGDDKYKEAAEDVAEGHMPFGSDVAIPLSWHEVSAADVPYPEYFNMFVNHTMWFGDAETEYSFDSSDPKISSDIDEIFSDAFYGTLETPADEFSYSDDYYYDYDGTEWGDDLEEPDPRGWFSDSEYDDEDEEYYYYYDYVRAEKAAVDARLKNIYGLSDEQIEYILEYEETNRWTYADGGYYYRDYWMDEYGVPPWLDEIISIRTDGVRYVVTYDLGYYPEVYYDGDLDYDYDSTEVDHDQPYRTYYMVLEYKRIDGKLYLTMSYNGTTEPDILGTAGGAAEAEGEADTDTEAEDTEEDDD